MNVEVRAIGLRATRDKHHLTQRELACRLGVTQTYIPALEAGPRNPGPKLRQSLMQLFDCDFEDLFQVVTVNPAPPLRAGASARGRRSRGLTPRQCELPSWGREAVAGGTPSYARRAWVRPSAVARATSFYGYHGETEAEDTLGNRFLVDAEIRMDLWSRGAATISATRSTTRARSPWSARLSRTSSTG